VSSAHFVFQAPMVLNLKLFFVGADILVTNNPELFDKYLYVGITRAKIFVGITYHETSPKLIKSLRFLFQKSWA
jgi:hypothetical protein